MISDVYFPRINGVSTSIRTFHKELTGLGHEITLVAPEYGADDEHHDWLFRIPSRYLPVDPEDRVMKRKYITALRKVLLQNRYDIIHIQTPFVAHYSGIDLARRLNIPCVESYHTHFEEYLHHSLPFLPKRAISFSARWFNRRQCNNVDAVIVPSTIMREVLTGHGIKKPIEIISTGINEEFFRPGDGMRFRRDYAIDPERPVLVYVGRVAHEKNIDFLLHMLVEVCKTIPDVLLIIAGEGPAQNHLHALTRTLKLDDNVRFIGYLDRAITLLDCYCAGDVFVFSSKTETQGLVLLEAMAQGVPVVSISVLGTSDILDANRGALIAEERTEDFAGKVVRVLMEPGLRQLLSTEARAYAQTWSANVFAVKAATFYEKTVNNYFLN